METGMTDKRQGRHTEHLRTKIAAGYILIFLLVGGIVHLWVDEWRKLETFETENHRINALRMEVHDVYVRVVELSLLGETVLEWEVADVEEYRDKRQAVDSLLCRFKNIYPAERIDSVRRLLEDKEKQLCGIMRVLDEQEDINERIAERVPVIAWKSTQEEPKKTKRKGFMLWGPMVFMMAVTFTALSMTIVKLSKAFMTTGLDVGNTLQLIFAVLLLILGVLVAIQGVKKLLEKPDDKKATA